MVTIDLSGSSVLITGGTKGIGLAAAYNFSSAGAKVFLTYNWGSADEEELLAGFDRRQLSRPILIRADVSREDDTIELMKTLADHCDGIDVYICNVAVAQQVHSLDDYNKKAFYKTLDFSSWPLVDYCQKIHAQFSRYPRYVIGVSSSGPDHVYPSYDFVAIAKGVMEIMARYLAVRLGQTSIVNVVRFGAIETEYFKYIFGEGWFENAREQGMIRDELLTVEDCGKSLLALCSGLFDAMRGQVINIDRGLLLQDNAITHMHRALAAE